MGNIIDAHDGSIQQFEKNGLYYVHAMQYGLCEEPPNYGCDGVSEFNPPGIESCEISLQMAKSVFVTLGRDVQQVWLPTRP